jgi:hypothetical protein
MPRSLTQRLRTSKPACSSIGSNSRVNVECSSLQKSRDPTKCDRLPEVGKVVKCVTREDRIRRAAAVLVGEKAGVHSLDPQLLHRGDHRLRHIDRDNACNVWRDRKRERPRPCPDAHLAWASDAGMMRRRSHEQRLGLSSFRSDCSVSRDRWRRTLASSPRPAGSEVAVRHRTIAWARVLSPDARYPERLGRPGWLSSRAAPAGSAGRRGERARSRTALPRLRP